MVATISQEVKGTIANYNTEQSERLTDLILRKGRLSLLQAIRIADTACRELVLTHELQLVHGSIEPNNLWVKLDGQARIGFDFSQLSTSQMRPKINLLDSDASSEQMQWARLLELEDSRAKKGSNLYYMAPEQGPGNQVVTKAADIYALGATLYSAITGHHYLPFRTPKNQLDYTTIAYNYELICERKPQPARRYNLAVTPVLDALIAKCLEKQPENRYPSVISLKQALREVSHELEQRRDALFNEAAIAEASQNWQQAMRLYDEVLTLDEWHSEATLARMRIYQKIKQPAITSQKTELVATIAPAKPSQILLEISYPRAIVTQPTFQPQKLSQPPKAKSQLRAIAKIHRHHRVAPLWERCLLWSLPGIFAVVATVGLLKMNTTPLPKKSFYAAALPASGFVANPTVNPAALASGYPAKPVVAPSVVYTENSATATRTIAAPTPTASQITVVTTPVVAATNAPASHIIANTTVQLSVAPTAQPTPSLTQAATATPSPAKVNLAATHPTPASPTTSSGDGYIVQYGDNLSSIAARFGVSVEALAQANNIIDANAIYAGQLLRLPNANLNTATPNNTTTIVPTVPTPKPTTSAIQTSTAPLNSTTIAVATPTSQNVPTSTPTLQPSPTVLTSPSVSQTPSPVASAAPTATPTPTSTALATGSLIWPVHGIITTYFSAAHPGIDIASTCGTPTLAADGGTVIEAGWSTVGYGNTVVIDHGNGMHTRYAHFAALGVIKGDIVTKGEIIGYEGSTGNSTGCHVHFEVWVNNVAVNPLGLLPPQ